LSACGSVEMTIFFGCPGGKITRTTEINAYFRPAAGEKRRLRSPLRKQKQLCVSTLSQAFRDIRYFSVDVGLALRYDEDCD
jgi:hypothetical protein